MKRRRFKPYIKVHKEGYAILFSLLTLLVVLNILVYLQSPAKIVVFIQLLISVTAFSFCFSEIRHVMFTLTTIIWY